MQKQCDNYCGSAALTHTAVAFFQQYSYSFALSTSMEGIERDSTHAIGSIHKKGSSCFRCCLPSTTPAVSYRTYVDFIGDGNDDIVIIWSCYLFSTHGLRSGFTE